LLQKRKKARNGLSFIVACGPWSRPAWSRRKGRGKEKCFPACFSRRPGKEKKKRKARSYENVDTRKKKSYPQVEATGAGGGLLRREGGGDFLAH